MYGTSTEKMRILATSKERKDEIEQWWVSRNCPLQSGNMCLGSGCALWKETRRYWKDEKVAVGICTL